MDDIDISGLTGVPRGEIARGYLRLLRENNQMRAGICTGCGCTRADAIAAVAVGKVACCPDCSTLSVDERNAVREAVEQQRNRADAAEFELHAERLAHAETQAKLGVTS